MGTKGEKRVYKEVKSNSVEIRTFYEFLSLSLDNGYKVLYNVGKNRKSVEKMGIIKKATFKIK
jgi:hypothetical protein